VRNKRELNASLQGATLGDADADTDDTLKWIKLSKKREKELAKKRQAELESMDKVFQEEYTESEHTPRVCLPTTDICLSQRTWRV
jgi:U4/U6.U5 tri-snRNP-associated protein 1